MSTDYREIQKPTIEGILKSLKSLQEKKSLEDVNEKIMYDSRRNAYIKFRYPEHTLNIKISPKSGEAFGLHYGSGPGGNLIKQFSTPEELETFLNDKDLPNRLAEESKKLKSKTEESDLKSKEKQERERQEKEAKTKATEKKFNKLQSTLIDNPILNEHVKTRVEPNIPNVITVRKVDDNTREILIDLTIIATDKEFILYEGVNKDKPLLKTEILEDFYKDLRQIVKDRVQQLTEQKADSEHKLR